MTLIVRTLGVVDYETAHQRQKMQVDAMHKSATAANECWLLHHPPVYTIGRRKNATENLLNPTTTIPIVHAQRGGDITYHDPGQVTGYLFVRLIPGQRDLHRFLQQIETSIIETLNRFTAGAHRVSGKTGVFFENKKICSIGIGCRHWITYHGFSININANLEAYKDINPCGFNASIMANCSDFFAVTPGDFIRAYREVVGQSFGGF